MYKTDSVFILTNNNEGFSNDFWSGVTASLIGAIIGAILSFLIAWFFSWREKNKYSNMIWYSMREEMTSNYDLAKDWLEKVDKELDSKENAYFTFPFRPFQTKFSFGNTFMFNIPKKLKKNPAFFQKIRRIHQSFELTNDIIHKIEDYKKIIQRGYQGKSQKDIDNIKNMNEPLKDSLLLVLKLIESQYNDLIIDHMKIDDELDKIK